MVQTIHEISLVDLPEGCQIDRAYSRSFLLVLATDDYIRVLNHECDFSVKAAPLAYLVLTAHDPPLFPVQISPAQSTRCASLGDIGRTSYVCNKGSFHAQIVRYGMESKAPDNRKRQWRQADRYSAGSDRAHGNRSGNIGGHCYISVGRND